MRLITTFWSTRNLIYDGGPIRLQWDWRIPSATAQHVPHGCVVMLVLTHLRLWQSYKGSAHTSSLIMTIHDYAAGLCVYCTFMVISTCRDCAVLRRQRPHTSRAYWVQMASSSLDFTSRGLVQQHAGQAGSLGATGQTTWACVSALCDFAQWWTCLATHCLDASPLLSGTWLQLPARARTYCVQAGAKQHGELQGSLLVKAIGEYWYTPTPTKFFRIPGWRVRYIVTLVPNGNGGVKQ